MQANTTGRRMLCSPRQTIKQAADDGYPVSENAIRTWLRTGELPHVQVGNRKYINYERFLEFVGMQN